MPSRNLTVAIDIGPLHGHRTGVGVAVAGMVAELAGRDGVRLHRYLTSYRSEPGSDEHQLPVPGIVASHLWSRLDRPRADRWLPSVDVVHGTNYVAPPSGLPTVISVYDCWFLRRPELAVPVVRRAGRILRRAVARGAWVHATSDATAAEVRSLLGTDRVATVHLGAPPASVVGATPPVAARLGGRPFVVSIATEERRKRLPLLVRAFDRVAAGRDEIRLVLAGATGDDSAAIESAIEATPSAVRDRIHRLGVVDDPTKAWLLRHAAVLAYPSVDEGFGFPILEAQASGTPVVASDVGSIPEIAGDAAVLVAGDGPEQLAGAIEAVVSDSVSRLGMIEAGYRNVRRFDWSATVDGLIELYTRAAESA
jgi:glycosyltransferase involved in cell wall biosynthesis